MNGAGPPSGDEFSFSFSFIQWTLGIIAAGVASLLGLSWRLSSRITEIQTLTAINKSAIEQHDVRIRSVETTVALRSDVAAAQRENSERFTRLDEKLDRMAERLDKIVDARE